MNILTKKTTMPYMADTRCGLCKIEFNIAVICEELENMTDCYYNADDDKQLWLYVYDLENDYVVNCCDGVDVFERPFWDYFNENYNNVDSWDIIQKNLYDRETDKCYYDIQNNE
jgi:hypothetical protein